MHIATGRKVCRGNNCKAAVAGRRGSNLSADRIYSSVYVIYIHTPMLVAYILYTHAFDVYMIAREENSHQLTQLLHPLPTVLLLELLEPN